MPHVPSPPLTLVNLQILRGIAAASVVYYHIGAAPNFGSFGVDIFFVLSGFVMAMIVEKGPSPGQFLTARLCRILPLYWLLTVVLFLAARAAPWLLNSASADAGALVKSLLFIPFFRPNGDLYPLLGVGWTLNYEMFFYGCIFVSLLVFRRRWLPVTGALLIACHVVLGHLFPGRVANAFFGSSLLWEFLFGFFAFAMFRSGRLGRLPRVAGWILGVTAYGLMAWFESRGLAGAKALLYGVPATVVVLVALSMEGAGGEHVGPFRRILASVGDASYATYLSHYFLVVAVERVLYARLGLFDPRTPLGILVVIGMALAAGQLLYLAVDRPLHAYFKRKFT